MISTLATYEKSTITVQLMQTSKNLDHIQTTSRGTWITSRVIMGGVMGSGSSNHFDYLFIFA